MTTSHADALPAARPETAAQPTVTVDLQGRLRLLAAALGLFGLFVLFFAYVQFGTPGLAGNDGYYHARMGLLIRQEGLKPDFPWLPMTILNEADFYDHHLLYHVYLALFAGVDPAADGGTALTQSTKIASIILPSLAFMAIWWLLRGQGVPWAWLWAIGLFAVSDAFLYRMSMPRAQSASLLVLALALHWLFVRRYWLLLPLGFAYVWLYNAFPLLLVVAAVYVAVVWLIEKRFAWQALVFPAVGIALGVVINPYFPENVSFIISHLLPKIGESATRVGNEWYPYRTWTLVENSAGSLAAVFLAMLALGWREKRMDSATFTALLLTALFGFMLFKSRRFIEYYPALALIFAAFAAAPVLKDWREKRPAFRKWLPAGMAALLLLPLWLTLSNGRQALAKSKPADQYAAAALWLRDHVPAGDMVFQTDWDDFTRLIFYNSDVIYTAGLDPTYMELYDEALWDEWVDITRGRVDDLSGSIRQRFNASYVFSDLNHEAFIEKAAADPDMQELYRDEYAVIFGITE